MNTMLKHLFSPSQIKPQNDTEAGLRLMQEPAVLTVNLHDYGHEQSGRHNGDALALQNMLENIRSGHLLDERLNAQKQQEAHQSLEGQIGTLKIEAGQVEGEIRNIAEVQVPAFEKEIRALEDRRQNLEFERAEALDKSRESRFNFYMYLLVFIPASLFLYGFYVSAFHNAFFRNIGAEVAQASEGNIQNLLNTVFNVGAFTQLQLHWLAPVVFFVFAMVLHRIWDMQRKTKYIAAVLVLAFVFLADGLLAYFIENNNHTVKSLMGMA